MKFMHVPDSVAALAAAPAPAAAACALEDKFLQSMGWGQCPSSFPFHLQACVKAMHVPESVAALAAACALQDKILQSMGRGQEVTVTNDGATILKSVYVDNPAAKVLVGEL